MNKLLATAALAASVSFSAQAVQVGDTLPATMKLTDSAGKVHTFADFAGKPVVLEWTNYGCPFVRKHYDSGNMQRTQKAAVDGGAVWLSVISSAEGKEGYLTPAAAPAAIAKEGFAGTAVVLDTDGTVGRHFGAQTTPHMFVTDAEHKVIYMGAIDSIPSFNKDDITKAENYVTSALTATKSGKAPATTQSKSYGCSIKY